MSSSSHSESYAGFYVAGTIGAVIGTIFALVVFGAGVAIERSLAHGHHAPAAHGEPPPAGH